MDHFNLNESASSHTRIFIHPNKAVFGKKNQNPRTPMGVEKQILTPGTGPKPKAGQKVTVHCTGYG